MNFNTEEYQKLAREKAYATPLIDFMMIDPSNFQNNTHWHYFARLRKEDPVHYCSESPVGPYWSVTKFNDIMYVDSNHQLFSSEKSITAFDPLDDFYLPNFIAMDPPKHDAQRKVVSPMFAPNNLAKLESLIRERAGKILDELPLNETFDWVDRVSIELTTQMLATLFDFPWEDRRKLTYWSDITTAGPGNPLFVSIEHRREQLIECVTYFTRLWNERVNEEPKGDLISMLAHGEATRNMDMMEYLGNLMLLIVGGNDTTRNSITGGLLFLNQNPQEYHKLKANPKLVTSMVPEIIRYQTPLAYMRRTATADTEVGGKLIRKGDKVLMWYVSGNRDDEVIENADAFIIDRERPRQHLSFGFGIHRCVGNRLAEMQLSIIWEEILKRWELPEVVGEPKYVHSSFVNGYESLPVRINTI